MIPYAKGPLVAIEGGVIMVGTGHVGLAIHVPISLLPEFPGTGEEVAVYTCSQIREDAMTLYGFLHSRDGDMFRQLLGVNGTGPKGTLGVPPVPRPDDLHLAIVSEDMKALAEAPGISNKVAQRLILDLKNKISVDDMLRSMADGVGMDAADTGASVAGLTEMARGAVQALVALGYTNIGASRVMKQVEVAGRMTSEDMLKTFLRHLSSLQGF